MKYVGSLSYGNAACLEASIENYYAKRKETNVKHYVMECNYPLGRDKITSTLDKLKKKYGFELKYLIKNEGFLPNLQKFLSLVSLNEGDTVLLFNLDGIAITKDFDTTMIKYAEMSDINTVRLNRAFNPGEILTKYPEETGVIDPNCSELEFMIRVSGAVSAFQYTKKFLSLSMVTSGDTVSSWKKGFNKKEALKSIYLKNVFEVLDPFIRMEDPEYLLYKRILNYKDKGVSLGSFEKFLQVNKTYAENTDWYEEMFHQLTEKSYEELINSYPEIFWE